MNKLITLFYINWICDTENENIQEKIKKKIRKDIRLLARKHFTTPGWLIGTWSFVEGKTF